MVGTSCRECIARSCRLRSHVLNGGCERIHAFSQKLKLAMQLIEQISTDTYDPTMFEDEEKKRILAAIDEKIAGKQIVAHAPPEEAAGGAQVIDLVEALRASLGKAAAPAKKAAPAAKSAAPAETPAETSAGKERKGVKRAAKVEEAVAPAGERSGSSRERPDHDLDLGAVA